MSRADVVYRKSLPPGVWIKKRLSMVFTLSFLALATYARGSEPSLFIPAGSYLKTVNIGNIYFYEGEMLFKDTRFRGTGKVSSPVASYENEQYSTPESCWKAGYDLTQGDGKELACDTGTNLSDTWTDTNAATFLNKVLVPYGNYLDSCTGILRTTEGEDDFLYASCSRLSVDRVQAYLFVNRLKISGCLHEPSNITNNEDITNHDGVLRCTGTAVKPKRILTGSYLESSSCSIANTSYDPNTGILTTRCGPLTFTLPDADQCIGSGKDILIANDQLTCPESPENSVELHTASLYLPAGNYLLSCRKMAFYPCLNSGRGRLVAECANRQGTFVSAQLVDGDGTQGSPDCIKSYGYVSNNEGRLVCDPSVDFNDASPTKSTMLSSEFQCPDTN